ncbi:MAG: hypothetical protein E7382_03190 [Clostridiales bacterium]|nr:hypothetical protein [Clostridiales bacterium]
MEKVVVLTIIFAVIILYLRSINGELAMLTGICAGIIILFYAFSYLSEVFSVIDRMIELTGIDRDMYKIIFKITSIGYLVEFGADTVSDFGLKSLADKLVFVGKIMIFSISLPIIYAIINLLSGIIQ